MKHLPRGLLLVIVLAWAAPAPAQWIFAKKQKVNPSQRVPELILIVKTDPDERKRTHAAEELRDYDSATFTEIVPVLVDVLHQDKKMNVRLEALNSLAKIRPVSARAGQAIEKAAAADESWRVRLQAKTSLPKYHLAGYSSRKSDPAPVKKTSTSEPPLAVSPPAPPASDAFLRRMPPGEASPEPKKAPPLEGPALFP
jgi:HEAT repeat protein